MSIPGQNGPSIGTRPEETFGRPLGLTTLESAATNRLQDFGLIGRDGRIDRAALKNLTATQISDIQNGLAQAGIDPGPIDGDMGPRTFKAMQQAMARKTLSETLGKEGDLGRHDIQSIQRALHTLGHDVGKIDGIAGENTLRGLADFVSENAIDTGPMNKTLKAGLGRIESNPAMVIAAPEKITAIDPEMDRILGATEHGSADIRHLQSFLKDNGADIGKVDGDLGPRTMKGLAGFLEANPSYQAAMGPNLTLEMEIYAADHKVSDTLKKSLNLRDLSKMPEASDEIRYRAYKDYFAAQGKPEELARGIKAASEMTGVPMQNLFAVMKQESINFGDYNPARGNSSANRKANNYGQFLDSDYRRMTRTYGETAQKELAREGIAVDLKKDWRDNPLVAPYMVAQRLKESGSTVDLDKQYPAHVMPVLTKLAHSDAKVASRYPAEAQANRHIFYDHGRALSFKESIAKINESVQDDLHFERKLVIDEQRHALKDELVNKSSQQPILFDRNNIIDQPAFEKAFAPMRAGLDGVASITSAFTAGAQGSAINEKMAENVFDTPRHADNMNYAMKLAL